MLASFAIGECLDICAFGRDGLDVQGRKSSKLELNLEKKLYEGYHESFL